MSIKFGWDSGIDCFKIGIFYMKKLFGDGQKCANLAGLKIVAKG